MAELYIKVKPGSKEFRIEKATYPIFHLENPAENGKANTELIKRIQNITGVKPAIISGYYSKRKKIKIELKKQEFENYIYDRMDES